MKEVLFTSSVLIAALLLLRRVFRDSVPRRVQYALWALALARLLLPVSLPASGFSVLTAARPVGQAVEARWQARSEMAVEQETSAPTLPDGTDPAPASTQREERTAPPALSSAHAPAEDAAAPAPAPDHTPDPSAVLRYIWLAGSIAVGAFFLVSNLRFTRRLRKYRTPYKAEGCTRTVYLTGEGVLSSPCLFGLFRPAIYLTPAALSSPETLQHVLAHEETHARHLDQVWALLRCVCLTVYWFDPLVWAAALASKTDCELACDEGVMAGLGEDERLSYGRALLSIAPVGNGSNPLLTATTMSSGKRQLRDRLRRVARRPQRLVAGTLAIALLAGILTACTFTGAAGTPSDQPGGSPDAAPASTPASTPSPTPTPVPAGEQDNGRKALTVEELRWFNSGFFNSGGAGENRQPYVQYGDGNVEYFNIRNQFANPLNLYEKPTLIDLDELFYCSGSTPSDEELRSVLGVDPENMACPSYKITTEEINAILEENTGLTLGAMNRSTLTFTYAREYDAYYWSHGDTNYPGELSFFCGTREHGEDGDKIRLYQNSGFGGGSCYCVTLLEREDSSYWFVSNLKSEPPAIPPAMPKGEPMATIPLADLTPCAPPLVSTEPRPEDDFGGSYEDCFANWELDGHRVQVYRADNGKVYAVAEQADGTWTAFLSDITGACFVSPFHDLFGRDGFYVEYESPGLGKVCDFFCFDDGDVPSRLLQCVLQEPASVMFLDLDGNGTSELVCGPYLYFQRDGEIYEANLARQLRDARPDLGDVTDCAWEPCGRYCTISGVKEGGDKWSCMVFYDGESLRAYSLLIVGVATTSGQVAPAWGLPRVYPL